MGFPIIGLPNLRKRQSATDSMNRTLRVKGCLLTTAELHSTSVDYANTEVEPLVFSEATERCHKIKNKNRAKHPLQTNKKAWKR